jgi:hypothetical protein
MLWFERMVSSSQEKSNATEIEELYLLLSFLPGLSLAIIWRIYSQLNEHLRTVISVYNCSQQYFVNPNKRLSLLKKNLLYAPIASRRRMHEFRFQTFKICTLPTRLQLILLLYYFTANITFCLFDISLTASFVDRTRHVRNRTGALALVNLVSRHSSLNLLTNDN